MTRIFMHIPDSTACSYYRGTLPVLHCYSDLAKEGIQLVGDHKPLEKEYFDAYIFHSVMKPDFLKTLTYIMNIGKKLVWETDDDLWNIPEWSPAYCRVDLNDKINLSKLISAVDFIHVSTDYLGQLIGKPNKTYVLPNLVDLSCFPKFGFSDSECLYEKPLRILWAGSGTHAGDLKQVIEPIINLLDKYKNKIQFIFWGYLPEEFVEYSRQTGNNVASTQSKYGDQILYIPWGHTRMYFDKLVSLQPDIAIAPLYDCIFNYSKSYIKSLETIMAGAAFIGSNLPPYQWIQNGTTGLLANTSNDWYNLMESLIIDKELRSHLVINGQKEIKEKHCWQSPSKEIWLKAFKDILYK
jgi:glycosyltransferase involved in cell wall biosynthesis